MKNGQYISRARMTEHIKTRFTFYVSASRTWRLWPKNCVPWMMFAPQIRWQITLHPPVKTRTPLTKMTMKRWIRRQVKSRPLARRTPELCMYTTFLQALHFQSRIHRFGLMDEIMLLLSRDAFWFIWKFFLGKLSQTAVVLVMPAGWQDQPCLNKEEPCVHKTKQKVCSHQSNHILFSLIKCCTTIKHLSFKSRYYLKHKYTLE